MKSGFVAVIGRPNAGKSSLINRLVGERVSIVSPKSQTTRDKICGILNHQDYQVIFVDTPGIHAAKNKLSEYMLGGVRAATEDTDLVLVVIDGTRGLSQGDESIIERYKRYPLIVAYNKIDAIGYDKSYPDIERLSKIKHIKEIFPVSARTGENLDLLLRAVLSFIPEGARFYPEDEYTDKDLRFIAGEIVREKTLYCLDDEIPHGVGVVVTDFSDDERVCHISADIVCEKKTHKPIIIGKGGEMIKLIGTKARESLERMLNKKVNLNLFVKVKVDWRDKPSALRDIGYRKD